MIIKNRPLAVRDFRAIVIITLLGAVVLAGCSSNSQNAWETAKGDFLGMPGDLWQDNKQLFAKDENLAILILAGGASGYVREAHDDEIARHFERQMTFPRDLTIGIGTAGSPATHFAIAGSAYLYSLLAQDDRSRSDAYTMLEALSLTGLYTMGLKVIAQDHSPNGESLAWPSGHTSSTVTVATVMNELYGPWVGLPLFGLSGLVMYERMDTGEHWASDLIFGAAIGYTVGKTVVGRNKPIILGMNVMPYLNPESGSTGIAFFKQF